VGWLSSNASDMADMVRLHRAWHFCSSLGVEFW
jgi:hypothetical protein